MSSHEVAPAAIPLPEQYSDAVATLVYYEPQLDGRPMDTEVREIMKSDMADRANSIFARFGIPEQEAVRGIDYSGKGYYSHEAVDLQRAADVAAEAMNSGFALELPDAEMKATAHAMIADYLDFTDETIRTHRAPQEDRATQENYSARRTAKRLLIEAAARELSRRNGIPDNLVDTNVEKLQAATGVPFAVRRNGFMAAVTERWPAVQKPQWKQNRDAVEAGKPPRYDRVPHGDWMYKVHAVEPGTYVVDNGQARIRIRTYS